MKKSLETQNNKGTKQCPITEPMRLAINETTRQDKQQKKLQKTINTVKTQYSFSLKNNTYCKKFKKHHRKFN